MSRALGGVEGTPLDWFRATTRLAEEDPSVAWIVGQGVVQNAWVSLYAAPDFARDALADPAALPATSINGKGTLTRLDDDWFELTGTWQFLSGCSGATLIGGVAFVLADDRTPEPRFVVVSAREAVITKTWDSFGFSGTGSHTASVGPLRISSGQTWLATEDKPQIDHPFRCFKGGFWAISGSAAAVQVGIARRALDEALGHTRRKAQALVHTGTQAPLAENAAVLRQIGRAEGLWQAARASAREVIGDVWDAACRGPVPTRVFDRCQLACATAVWQRADVITQAYNIGGTTAQANSNSLQRCFRDGHILTAHISSNDAAFERLGRLLVAIE